MSTEENKAIIIRHLKEVLEQGHVELIGSYYAPENQHPGLPSPEEWKNMVLEAHKVYSDVKITILAMLAEGDQVMAHIQFDVTSTNGKQESWRLVNVFRIVGGQLVSEQSMPGGSDFMTKKIEQNQAAVRKFVDAVNNQDTASLAEICTQELAKAWTEALPGVYARFKDHHVEITDLVADGESVAAKMNSSGIHTGDFLGLPPTGMAWTNQGITYFKFSDGKIASFDGEWDVVNHITQLGGAIQPVTTEGK